jgi:hypothetical protein
LAVMTQHTAKDYSAIVAAALIVALLLIAGCIVFLDRTTVKQDVPVTSGVHPISEHRTREPKNEYKPPPILVPESEPTVTKEPADVPNLAQDAPKPALDVPDITLDVPRPEPTVRVGAICMDGWRSHATGSGACSYHGGVAEWLDIPFSLYKDLVQDKIALETALRDEAAKRAEQCLADLKGNPDGLSKLALEDAKWMCELY